MACKFPPEQYPLVLHITFGGTLKDLQKELKTCLNKLPKEEVKYQNTGKYINSFCCYLQSVDAMRPVLYEVLNKTRMHVDYVGIEDKRVYPRTLIKMGQEMLQNQQISH